ncbi:MAG: DUF4157 domain-containing protein [Stenomitos rutilans HA7619-LM2]|nr:DUF4157 domain-containing protein [Stenomitos rutilans HA7619-LM2]
MIENINRSLAAASPPELPTLGLEGVQAKLTLGTPGDVYEQEADQVARQVVDEIHSDPFQAPSTRSEEKSQPKVEDAGRVQRQITVQAAGDAEGEISSEWEAQLQGAKSGGQPLSLSVKEPMEQAFGADFSGVRVHTGAQADGLARSIQAKAFTTKQDVFFGQGAYEPGSRGGQELIAHELTHVVQQKFDSANRATIKNGKKKGGSKDKRIAEAIDITSQMKRQKDTTKGKNILYSDKPILRIFNKETIQCVKQYASSSSSKKKSVPKNTRTPFTNNIKKAQKEIKKLLGKTAFDLAHRLSYHDIAKTVQEKPKQAIMSMIKKVTIPQRNFGTYIKIGDKTYYNNVVQHIHDTRKLIRLLNSSPYNLRPGVSSDNRSIGKRYDGVYENGKLSPQSKGTKSFG